MNRVILKPPLVSVIIPNYNYSRYLPERIESILKQTFKNIEIIIIDDASTDNSREIIDHYKGKYNHKIKAVYYVSNSGNTYQRWNDGAKHAAGKYILFAGADDFCDENMIYVLVQSLEKDPSCGVAYCDSWIVDENSNRKYRFSEKRHITTERQTCKFTNKTFVNSFLTHESSIPNASGALIIRSLFEKMFGFDKEYTIAADVLLWIKLSCLRDILYVNEPLNCYRKHSNSVTSIHRGQKKLLEVYEICSVIMTLEPKAKSLQIARNRYSKQWAQKLLLPKCSLGHLSKEDHLLIYNAAKKFDRFILARLCVKILEQLLVRFRCLLKEWRL